MSSPRVIAGLVIAGILFSIAGFLVMADGMNLATPSRNITQQHLIYSNYFYKDGMPCMLSTYATITELNEYINTNTSVTCDWSQWDFHIDNFPAPPVRPTPATNP